MAIIDVGTWRGHRPHRKAPAVAQEADTAPVPLPLPDQPPGWATIIGGWGEAIAGLGNIQQVLKHTHGVRCGVIYYGFEPGVVELLAAQPYIREVRHLLPAGRSEYVQTAALASRERNHGWLLQAGCEEIPEGVWSACLDFVNPGGTEVYRPSEVHLPFGVREWAKGVLADDELRAYLLFPRSEQSTNWGDHWPYWLTAIGWLLQNTPHRYYLCGRGWELPDDLRHERLTVLLGDTESMAQVYALAEQCDGIITTNGNLAVWATAQRKPAVVACNIRHEQFTYFQRWITADHLRHVRHEQHLPAFESACDWLWEQGPPPEGVPVVVSPTELSDGNPIQLCVPPGIGDFSWIYSKIRHLREMTGHEVLIYSPEETPLRVNALVPLLPDVHWGGVLRDRDGFGTICQSLPSDWPDTMGWGIFVKPYVLNISANLHLELGHPLAEWMPKLPTDYHYPVQIPVADEKRAETLLRGADGPLMAVYVSNRDKERYPEWALWSSKDWADFLEAMAALIPGVTFVLLGAEYDRDKTALVAELLDRRKLPQRAIIAEDLGVALAAMKRCCFGVYYPSGLGILASVLRVPGAMLLPKLLKGLTESWLDPADVKAGRFRCFPAGTTAQVLAWAKKTGLKHVGKA